MKTLITCTVNGEERTVLADTRDTLLELLRDRLGLTGTKEGCGNGNCGTCTVLVDGAPVNACLVLALEAPGRDIITIEGLSDGGELHPIQQALVEHGGTQCGFCTPGIVLSAKALLDANPQPDGRRTSATPSPATCAAAPATARSSRPSRPPPSRHATGTLSTMAPHATARRSRWSASALPRVDARERVTGEAVYPADLDAAGHGARQAAAQPARARPHPPHRHLARRGAEGRARRRHRRRFSRAAGGRDASPWARSATTCGWWRRSTWRATRCTGSASRWRPSPPSTCTSPKPRWR